ncbi:HlyD family efflux transporter periplasmic adaptor subunit [Corynebacterium canis]|uniref:HlyD family efflux transporter periplasmic adaptor subunit n=1 Tax=Corynebacterium canis TaxID=679663 RepID=A0A5C5TWX3_9CORY|nr:efflux RND transporter periplasmic adaptor subunit [Corynebacterium canis]TWT17775.1 HlyD family efflux transporter periplasmic adaptor subunit [Corynebacterium canis]WJY74892.1 Macrolide export protein MacA [Corynebacterium canis]
MSSDVAGASPQPRHRLKKVFSRRSSLIFIALALLLVVALAFLLMRQFSGTAIVPANDYKVLSSEKYSNKVAVTGAVSAGKTATLVTHLTGPVKAMNVKLGDRVNAEQLIAQIDVTSVERDLERQRAEQASTEAGNLTQVEQAQTQYNQYKDALDRGLNPEVNNAAAAARTANDQYVDAVAAFDNKQADKDAGRDPLIRDQANAVENARSQVLTAAINTVRSGVGIAQVLGGSPSTTTGGTGGAGTGNGAATQTGDTGNGGAGNGGTGDTGNGGSTPDTQVGSGLINGALNSADALNQLNAANQNLTNAEKTYIDNLAKVDQELATAQRGVSTAFAGKKEAETALEAARLASSNQLVSYEQAVQQAVRAAEAGHRVTELSENQLRYDIASGEIRAPFNGVITKVVAQEGQPANGTLLAVGDDSKLLIDADVKEVDIPKISVGTPVKFTTVATGTKQFQGQVASVSPVGASAADKEGAEGATSSKKVSFPVQIEVTGDREGLLIGGSAKVQIITDELPNVITVPRDAIFSNDKNEKAVLVAAERNGQRVVEERSVKIKTSNDVEAVIDNGSLKVKDVVLTQPDNYRKLVGQQVTLEETAKTTTKQG